MASTETLVQASQDLTFTGQPSDTETLTIGTKVYTVQTALTNVDGNVKIGASASATIDNLVAAINLGSGAGTTYAAAMTRGASFAVKVSATVLRVYAGVAGAIGNNVVTTETLTNASFGATKMAGGTGSIVTFLEGLFSKNNMNSEMLMELKKLSPVESAVLI